MSETETNDSTCTNPNCVDGFITVDLNTPEGWREAVDSQQIVLLNILAAAVEAADVGDLVVGKNLLNEAHDLVMTMPETLVRGVLYDIAGMLAVAGVESDKANAGKPVMPEDDNA